MQPIVLHIDTEKGFRGGQQQALYLHRGLLSAGYASYFAFPADSMLQAKLGAENTVAYRYRNELDILSGFKLARFVRKHRINLLHAHSAHALSIAILTRLFAPQCKIVATRRVDFRIRGFLSPIKYRQADRIVCISREIKRVMLECGIVDDKLEVIYSGVDLQRFADCEADRGYLPESLRGHRIVGTVAALAGHKDYPNLLGAAKAILDSYPDAVFVSLGDGPEREKILALASDEPLKSRFLFLGHRTDVGRILKSFDLFVLASRKEGLGTSVIDAMALGLPIVATDAGGIPEMIRDRENGILVERQNSDALAEGIRFMLDHPDFAREMGRRATSEAERFSVQKMVEGNRKIYRRLAGIE